MIAKRGKWDGLYYVVRFNWPLYLIALVIFIASLILVSNFENRFVLTLSYTVALVALWFIGFSLLVTHLVYDRSDLYRWNWIKRATNGEGFNHGVLCHSGFDDVSVNFAAHYSSSKITVLDHYDPQIMNEPSINRARKLYPNSPSTLQAAFNNWPLDANSADFILGMLAIHELRTASAREAWFKEAGRVVTKNGKIVIVEHLRNFANFLAFGPGFLHFHSASTWQNAWQAATLKEIERFNVTPLIQVFVLQRAS